MRKTKGVIKVTWHPKTDRRLERLERLDRASRDKYCWAQMVYLGMCKYDSGEELENAKEACRSGPKCRGDSIKEGSCWCNKFVDGNEVEAEKEGGTSP